MARRRAISSVASRGIAEVYLHNPKSGKNPHVHILATMRTLDGDKFSAKKPREWNDKGLLVHWRESWAKAENDALESIDENCLFDFGREMGLRK